MRPLGLGLGVHNARGRSKLLLSDLFLKKLD